MNYINTSINQLKFMGCILNRMKINPIESSSTSESSKYSSCTRDDIFLSKRDSCVVEHKRKISYQVLNTLDQRELEAMYSSYIENLANPKVVGYLIWILLNDTLIYNKILQVLRNLNSLFEIYKLMRAIAVWFGFHALDE